MDFNITEAKWKDLKGKIRKEWGDLTNDEVEKSQGNIDQIVSKIQERYGVKKQEAAKKFNDFLDKHGINQENNS